MNDEFPTVPPRGEPRESAWERKLIEQLAMAAVTEQRRARRWSIFFKALFFMYILFLLMPVLLDKWDTGPMSGSPHTALIELEGEIMTGSEASADNVVTGLREAFKDKRTKGVILRINSPGGSPVQAGYINDEIYRLRNEYPNIPLYVVITDMCASGGYYVAAAANKIYADKASLVGSIGVLMDGFGFVGSMDKLGIERRMLAAGEHKGFLDPFSPLKEGDVEHIRKVLGEVHKQFIDTVKKGRGSRLKDNPELFSGLVWTGEQALELGLVDAMGSSSFVAREVVGAESIVDFTHREDYLDRFAKRLGTTVASLLTSPPQLR
jgi:protease-4